MTVAGDCMWAAVTAELVCNTTATLGINMHCIDLPLVSVSSSQNLTCDKRVLSDNVTVKVEVTGVLYFATTPFTKFLTFNS
jgi:hypothetical protein